MAAFIGRTEGVYVSHHYVAKLWRDSGLKPHRHGTFKLSKDPQFAAKVADVVGLYLQPPGGAVVLSIDEKTQIQALDRTQPMLPMGFFGSRAFSAGNAAIFLTFASLFGAVFFYAQLLQTGLGYGPLGAGLENGRFPVSA